MSENGSGAEVVALTVRRAEDADKKVFEAYVKGLDGVATLTQDHPDAPEYERASWYVAQVAADLAPEVIATCFISPHVAMSAFAEARPPTW